MMTREEHLLSCLAEECAEVAQRVSKALRFGLNEVQPGQDLNNSERICLELVDLISVAMILGSEGALAAYIPNDDDVAAKLARIEKFMAISRAQRALDA